MNPSITEGTPVVVQFTVASAPLSAYPKIGISNAAGSQKLTYALASSPCAFPSKTSPDPVLGTKVNSTPNFGGTLPFTVPGTKANVYGTPLQLGGTYYVNIQGTGSGSIYVDLYN